MKKGLKGIFYHLCFATITAVALLSNALSLQVKAQAMAATPFFYEGRPVQYIAPVTGYYKLEVWGAEGSNNCTLNCSSPVHKDGLGGYAVGIAHLTAGQSLWVVVGGSDNGYNGGGGSFNHGVYSYGGGATHIGTFNSTLAAHGSAEGVYIVAGGGGSKGCSDDYDAENLTGGAGGGFNGVAALSNYGGQGGTQSGGGAGGVGGGGNGNAGTFGQGGSGAGHGGNGGGGFFGGGGGGEEENDEGDDYNCGSGGGGGSSYLGSLEQSYTVAGIWSGNGKAVITPLDNTTVCEYPTSFSWVCPATGYYALEAWGAQGGNGEISCDAAVGIGGNGGYAYGKAYLTEGTILQITVGAKGLSRYEGQAQDGKVKEVNGDAGGDTVITALSGAVYVRGSGGGGGSDWCQAHDIGGGDIATPGYAGGFSTNTALVSDSTGAAGIRAGNGKVIITPLTVPEPGGGGSNYVNTDLCINPENTAGVQPGNGFFRIQSVNLGFIDNLYLNGVAAPDLAAPEAVQTSGYNSRTNEEAIRIEPVPDSNGTAVTVTWTEPKDRGNTYFHKAESYLALTGGKLCTSNVTTNTLITGVLGYYYIVNTSADTTVTAVNGTFTEKAAPQAKVTLSNTTQYLHIAPVDVAGNVGDTSHVPISIGKGLDVQWPLYTTQLSIAEGDNVYPAEEDATWYVRCDDSTPIELDFSAYMEGCATETYQINQLIFASQMEGCEGAETIVEIPMCSIQNEAMEINASELSFANAGVSVLRNYTYVKTIRSNLNKNISITQQFLPIPDIHGKKVHIVPRAGVVSDVHEVYSEHNGDLMNGIYIIGDCQAPEIYGIDILEDGQLIDRGKENVTLQLSAEDDLSGMRELYVEIHNTDNGMRERYESDDGENLQIDLTADNPVFAGEFAVNVIAVDNVGNESREIYRVTEFALDAEVTRILSPHEPIFKRGESGMLTINTWGYVERLEVEFPGVMTDWDTELNKTYTYEVPLYMQREKIQFMIPLYADPDGEYEIVVRAYKGDGMLEELPFIEIKGTVLDEIRTRLR